MYEHDISGCLRDKVGGNGVEADILKEYARLLEPAVARYQALRGTGELALLDQPSRTDDIAAIIQTAARIRSEFDTMVVLGTGGSSLGGQMLVELKQSAFSKAGPRIVFVDNVDPHTLDALFAEIDLSRAFFLAISKSGSTTETLAQTLITVDRLRTLAPDAPKKHMLVITEPGDNPLRVLALGNDIPLMDHPPTLGGRFSVLSAVGLLPAAVAGLDIKLVRRGANNVLQAVFGGKNDAPPVLGAALHAGFIQLGKYINVVMPYCDRLRLFGAWYKQIWSESLGKQGKGSTALRAVGAVDQHSQLQLFLDGPRDKFITLVQIKNSGQGPAIPLEKKDDALHYLQGHKIGDLLDAQQRATAETLTHNGCPLRVMRLKELSEESLGELIMHFMMETIFTAELLGVNAFDQPAVEESKRLTREYLSRKNAAA